MPGSLPTHDECMPAITLPLVGGFSVMPRRQRDAEFALCT